MGVAEAVKAFEERVLHAESRLALRLALCRRRHDLWLPAFDRCPQIEFCCIYEVTIDNSVIQRLF